MRRAFLLLACLLAAGPPHAPAQELVPPSFQAAICLRMLEYDRALKSRSPDVVRIGIVFSIEEEASVQLEGQLREAFKSLGTATVQELPVEVLSHPYRDPASLSAWATRESVDVLYLAPPVKGALDSIRALAHQRKLVTMSPVRKDVEGGIALGILIKGVNPRLLVNLPVTQELGMNLDPKLLQLSEVLR